MGEYEIIPYLLNFLRIVVYWFLRKPASWLVAVCERSENRGCGGGRLPKEGTKSRRAPCVERQKTEHFAGLSTTRQFADGGGIDSP